MIDSLIIFSDSSLYDERPVGGFNGFLGGEQSLVQASHSLQSIAWNELAFLFLLNEVTRDDDAGVSHPPPGPSEQHKK